MQYLQNIYAVLGKKVLFPFRDLNLQFEGLVKAVIFCDIPEQFKHMARAFYSQAFQAYQSIKRKESGKMDTSGIYSIAKNANYY